MGFGSSCVLKWVATVGLMVCMVPVAAQDGKRPPELPQGQSEQPKQVRPASAANSSQIFFEMKGAAYVPMRTRVYEKQTITVYFDSCTAAEVKFNETERNSRLYEDIATLIKRAVAADQECRWLVAKHDPQFHRSNIKVTAYDGSGKEIASQTIIFGPVEHLSLGVDLPVSNRKTLKYDEASKSLLPKDESPVVYLSLNYLIGDVLEDPDHLSLMDRLQVKALVSGSKKPLDSYGVGIAYKLAGIKVPGMDLGAFTVFGGRFFSKSDAIVNGTPLKDQVTTKSWRVGISYDLSSGVKWLKF